jgi:alpha-methylacyl-CoA racemase
MPVILSGVHVLDFTRLLPGPYATLRLADMGADVLKVEEPGLGDPARHLGTEIHGAGAAFLATNRDKRSVTLDLKDPRDVQVAWDLIKKADVVMEGYRPGVAERLGIGYERVLALNPGIVYCSLEGYDPRGPMARMGGHDLNYMALSGILSLMSGDDGQAVMPHIQWADLLGGIAACEAILAALAARGRDGLGRHVEVAMSNVLQGLLPLHALVEAACHTQQGLQELTGQNVCYHLYRTRDGRQVALAALEPKFWANFCQAAHKPQWIGAQFSDAQLDNPRYAEIAAFFEERDWTQWRDFAQNADCCLTPVLTISEALEEPLGPAPYAQWDMDSAWGPLRQLWTFAGGTRPEPLSSHTPPPELSVRARLEPESEAPGPNDPLP